MAAERCILCGSDASHRRTCADERITVLVCEGCRQTIPGRGQVRPVEGAPVRAVGLGGGFGHHTGGR